MRAMDGMKNPRLPLGGHGFYVYHGMNAIANWVDVTSLPYLCSMI